MVRNDQFNRETWAGGGFVKQIHEARRIAQPAEFGVNAPDIPYRALSIYPSVVLAKLGVTANQITFGWIILGIAAVVALASPAYGVRVAGAILLEISYLFDFVDGEVARLTNHPSKDGYLLDLAGHGIIKTTLFLAIGYGYAAYTHHYEMLILAILACVGVLNGHMVPFFVAEAFPRSGPRPVPAPPDQISVLRILLNSAGYFFESPGLFLLVLLGAVSNHLGLVLWIYGILGPLWFLYRLARYRP